MKKMAILLITGIILGTGAMAQQKDIKKDEKVLKNTIKDNREDRRESGKDLAHLKVKSAIRENKEVGQHRRSIRKQGKHLKKHGVKHPVTKAKQQIREEKEIKKGKD